MSTYGIKGVGRERGLPSLGGRRWIGGTGSRSTSRTRVCVCVCTRVYVWEKSGTAPVPKPLRFVMTTPFFSYALLSLCT